MAANSYSNNGNTGDYGPAILGCAIATACIATLCILLRLYVRLRIVGNLWWDDGFSIVAGALSILGAVFNGLAVGSGMGKHTSALIDPISQSARVVQWNTAYQFDNIVGVTFNKISILLFVLRIPNSKRWSYLIYFVMTIMTILNLTAALGIGLQCKPLRKFWEPELPGTCYAKGTLLVFSYIYGVVNVLTDFFCAITPMLVLWNVKIKKRLKFGISGLMSIGFAATAAQIARVVYGGRLYAAEYTYSISPEVIAAVFDQNLGIIGACIPTFQPLFRALATQIKTLYLKTVESKSGSAGSTRLPQYRNPTGLSTQSNAGFDRKGAQPAVRLLDDSAGHSVWRISDDSLYPSKSLPTSGHNETVG